MANIAVTEVGMLSNMPRPVTLKAANKLRGANTCGPRGAMGATQVAHIIGMAVVTGEAVTGIRPMDILDWAITATAIRPTELAITVTATVGTTVRTPDTTLTATDIGGRP